MKHLFIILLVIFSSTSFAQEKEEQALLAQKKANDFVYQANELVDNEDYVSAEMEYRKAISEQPNYAVGAYNLGNSYYKKGNFEEALYRLKQTARHAITKDEKHKAFHNIGNVLMQNKQCKEATEAFKNALRNNPADNETRYNYALAKECAEQQEKDNKQDEDKKEDKQDENKEDQEKEDKEEKEDNEDQEKDKPEDEGDQDKKEGDDKKDEDGKPKDEKEDKGEQGENEQKQQPQPGQLSPQQVKNLLEAMNDQEQKVQDKMNAQKTKGARVQTEKDW